MAISLTIDFFKGLQNAKSSMVGFSCSVSVSAKPSLYISLSFSIVLLAIWHPYLLITQYGSTVYIGIAMVYSH